MWPALRNGDQAGLVSLLAEPVLGSVVIARVGAALIAHRVLEVGPGPVVRLRGDNSDAAEAPIPLEQVLGQVHSVRRAGRLVQRWDVGPKALGRGRVVVKRALVKILRGGA